MRSFTYQGVEYRSLQECCCRLKISYQKVRRLCRHYVRAHHDPVVAVRWCLGVEHRSINEPKTYLYIQDKEKATERQDKFKEKVKRQIEMMI